MIKEGEVSDWTSSDSRMDLWVEVPTNQTDRETIYSVFTEGQESSSTLFALKESGNISNNSLDSLVDKQDPEALRWPNQQITYCIDLSGNTLPFTDQQIIDQIYRTFSLIEDVCAARFVQVTNPNCDINITFEEYDGVGNVLGLVYLPSSGENISACNCGNVIMDRAESLTIIDFAWVFTHEALHAMGLPHIEGIVSLMNPFFIFGKTELPELDPWAINELRRRYPY